VTPRCAIVGFYDDGYAAYEELFVSCARMAYPEYAVHTFKIEESPAPANTAAMRFLVEWPDLGYDYALMTDLDILIHREDPPLLEQHLRVMEKEKLGCYENWITADGGKYPRMTGIHFVTKDWWKATRGQRLEELKYVSRTPIQDRTFDEWMIGRIIVDSGLPLPPQGSVKLWREHGIHLGRWRNTPNPRPQLYAPVAEFLHYICFESEEFKRMFEKAAYQRPEIGQIYEELKKYFPAR